MLSMLPTNSTATGGSQTEIHVRDEEETTMQALL
jgi:hypothetical protein